MTTRKAASCSPVGPHPPSRKAGRFTPGLGRKTPNLEPQVGPGRGVAGAVRARAGAGTRLAVGRSYAAEIRWLP